jgi:hypothetical protein
MLAATAKFLRQIVPPVIATLIAAVLIAAFNSAFQTHLTQPRMAAMHPQAGNEPAPTAPAAIAPTLVIEPMIDRTADKGVMREAGKDDMVQKLAEPAPPVPVRRTERVAETRPEPRQAEPHAVAAPVIAPAVIAAPVTVAPSVMAAPPARQEPVVVLAEPPMVTVPDRPRPLPPELIEGPPAPPQGPFGAIVNTLKPSSLFARAREFGEKIEAAGNEILPSIRQ